jgi:GTP diphosphokinase / guanosine-3',5'-bis(diphosphate) 3'-diphosphatase
MNKDSKKKLDKILLNCENHSQMINKKKLIELIELLEKIHEKEIDETNQLFINYVLRTGILAAEVGADEETIFAALLHNSYYTINHETIQNKPENKEIIKKKFGKNIIELIDSVKKIIEIEKKNKEKINEIIETVLIASSDDPKIILLRLIIQLDWLEKIELEKNINQKKYALETLNVYVPIAHKLGIYSIKALMEDKSFKIINPEKFNEIQEENKKIKELRKKELYEFISLIKIELEKNKINAKIDSRQKTIYSIYEKMKRKNISLKDIYDINAIRIIAKTIEDCYSILGIINSKWKNIPEEYDDYISKPKTNFYQSIHMAVLGPNQKPVEIQIRTQEMHELAEFGIASHSIYKGQKKSVFDFKFNLFNQIKKLKEEPEKKIEFNISSEKIIALTPEGEAIILPKNSTPIDFAYAVHSELGNKCEKAKVNGKLVTLDYNLSNLDEIEIITSKEQKPKLAWLSFVKSGKARAKINQFFNIINKKRKEIIIPKNTLIVKENDSRIKLAKCCNPLPGEEIIAINTTKRKYSIHKKTCTQLKKLEKKEKIKVEWGEDSIKNQETEILILAKEKPNLLIDTLKKIDLQNTPITNAKVITKEKTLKIIIKLKAKNLKQLNKIIDEITKIQGIIKVKRN